MYVDDIIITEDDTMITKELGQDLSKHFDIKDLGKLRYSMGIEVVDFQQGIVLSQHKYIFDRLKETIKIVSKLVAILIDYYVKFDSGEKSEPVNWEAF